MASEPEPGHVVCSAQRGTRLARTLFVSRRPKAQLIRTAVYGTVRTVVWEGWMSDCPPYPDQDWLPHVYHGSLEPRKAQLVFAVLTLFFLGTTFIWLRLDRSPAGWDDGYYLTNSLVMY